MTQPSPALTMQFGVYEVDLKAGELRKQGLRIKLQEKPFQVLALLLERPGELVTREELQKKLWPGDTFVDFDHSMNTAVNKLREALGDSAESPRFIETLPKRGYRFIAPVQLGGRAQAVPAMAPAGRQRPAVIGVVAALVVVLGVAAYLGWKRWAHRATPPEGRIMLAVLPFENLSGDSEQEYFSDGMTEEMISQLGQIHPERLGVIARTSAMKYKKTSKGVDEIGRELAVQYLVEGSVRRGGERVRITAQLVQVSDQTEVWSESFESGESDVLALQSEVARAIAQQIQVKLAVPGMAQPGRLGPVNAEAHDAYLKARYWAAKGVTDQAITSFEKAIAAEPDFALAHAGLADSMLFLAPAPEFMPKAKAAALKALELDNTLSDAHAALGLVRLMYEWDWRGAESSFRRALELDPSNAEAHLRYSHYLAAVGRLDEAIAEAQLAQRSDPLSPLAYQTEGRYYHFLGQEDRAIEQCKKSLELDPDFRWGHIFLSFSYRRKGMHDEAWLHRKRAWELFGAPPELISLAENRYRQEGFNGVLRTEMEAGEREARKGRMASAALPLTYVQLGDTEKALYWLQKAYENHTRDMIYIKVEPIYDPIRSDPRFKKIVEQMNFPKN